MAKSKWMIVLSFILAGLLANAGFAAGFDTTVYLLQEQLSRMGIDTGKLDGIFGEMTGGAVRRYQEAQNLPVTGRMDNDLLGKLEIKRIKTFILLPGQNFPEPKTKSDITIQTVEGGLVRLSGYIEFGMAHGEQKKLVWNNGATHHIVGPVEFGGSFEDYLIKGDPLDPLTFRVISSIGYVYVGGKGRVLRKSTKEVIDLGF